MKDVLRDLEQFCEENRLLQIRQSLADAEKVLDEEIRLREEQQMSPDRVFKKTSS